jgi:4-hydroxy-2-oxoheptanedioate aldolase
MAGNQFKQALKDKQAQIGLWMSLANSYTAELCATAGFDWLLLDGEHAPNDVRGVLEQLQAIAPYRSQPVVRPVSGDPALIKQLLDVGAQTLLVPMVDDAEQARRLVSAMRYPPEGMRGVGSAVARVSRWGMDSDYLARANDEVCLLVQAETRQALANLEEICAVDGVDGVFIGPADLSASMGFVGQPNHPEVQAVIADAVARIRKAGKAAGILSTTEEQARKWLAAGALFVAVGVDTILLAAAAKQLLAKYKAAPGATAPNGY